MVADKAAEKVAKAAAKAGPATASPLHLNCRPSQLCGVGLWVCP